MMHVLLVVIIFLLVTTSAAVLTASTTMEEDGGQIQTIPSIYYDNDQPIDTDQIEIDWKLGKFSGTIIIPKFDISYLENDRRPEEEVRDKLQDYVRLGHTLYKANGLKNLGEGMAAAVNYVLCAGYLIMGVVSLFVIVYWCL